MKVKIGKQIYDANEQPIMIILDESEKELISNMHHGNFHFCTFPPDWNVSEIEQFMKIVEQDPNQVTMAIDDETFKIPASYPGD